MLIKINKKTKEIKRERPTDRNAGWARENDRERE